MFGEIAPKIAGAVSARRSKWLASQAFNGGMTAYGVPLFRSGTFTGTLTGVSTNASPTVYYSIAGNLATLTFSTSGGTSTSTALTMTGLPTYLQPATCGLQLAAAQLEDNSLGVLGLAGIAAGSGTITFYRMSGGSFSTTGFTASGNKGVNYGAFSYLLN